MGYEEEIRNLTLADLIALHEAVMQRTGFAPAPLRDEGRLEAAVIRPRMAAYYEGADLIRQCALLAVGIWQAQAFLDGNKRTGMAVTDVFLRVNGMAYDGEPLEFARQVEAIAERMDSLEEETRRFERWLRQRVVHLDH